MHKPTVTESKALSQEIDATSTLFQHGLLILRDYRFAATDAEAVFVCLAGGAEKLLKLTLGVIAWEDAAPWPDKATMQQAGHRITDLDAAVKTLIEQRVTRSSAPGLINQLLEQADDSSVKLILLTLETYANQGRFHNLDALGGVAKSQQSPLDLWEELHRKVLKANPQYLRQLAEGPDFNRAGANVNAAIAQALGKWCELIYRAWRTGVCGAEASRWSAQLQLGHERT